MPAEYATAALLANHLYHGSLGGEYLREEQDPCEGQWCAQSVHGPRLHGMDIIESAKTQAREHEEQTRHVNHVPFVADVLRRVFHHLLNFCLDSPLFQIALTFISRKAGAGREQHGRKTGSTEWRSQDHNATFLRATLTSCRCARR